MSSWLADFQNLRSFLPTHLLSFLPTYLPSLCPLLIKGPIRPFPPACKDLTLAQAMPPSFSGRTNPSFQPTQVRPPFRTLPELALIDRPVPSNLENTIRNVPLKIRCKVGSTYLERVIPSLRYAQVQDHP